MIKASKTVGVRNHILDVGCGFKPYAPLFERLVYTGMEYDSEIARQSSFADVFYDGSDFPIENSSCDLIICNQVLEHVFAPDEFICEISRVLEENGYLILTVPFSWDEHEQPIDYARYTSFGLTHLLHKHKFEIIS